MKKKLLEVLLVLMALFIVMPKVNANVVCHDGTESKTCKTCEVGCCSCHGGCEEAKKKDDKTNWLLIGIVIVVGGACAIYYITTNMKLNKKKEKKEEKTNQED